MHELTAAELHRFFSFTVQGGVPPDRQELGPCLLRLRHQDRDGYSRFFWRGKLKRSHAVAFYIANGRWPDGNALHHCDNPPCVRGNHIWEGSSADNSADMVAKHRQYRGEKVNTAKITRGQAEEIRQAYAKGNVTQQVLAERYGIFQTTVSRIVLGQTWKD